VQLIISGAHATATRATARPGRACRRHTHGRAITATWPVADGYRRAREAAEKALALDPQLVEAHLAMGRIHGFYDSDWAAADASFRKALDLEPSNAQALRHAGAQALVLGRGNEAIDLANKAIERDPLRPNYYTNLGLALLAVNRDTEAEAAYRKALELDPDGASRHLFLGRPCL